MTRDCEPPYEYEESNSKPGPGKVVNYLAAESSPQTLVKVFVLF